MQTLDTYRLTSSKEPESHVLRQLMEEAFAEAAERRRLTLEKWFKENLNVQWREDQF